MSFIIKKVLSAIALPIPISITLLLIGLIFLFFTRQIFLGKFFVFTATAILIIFSTAFFPSWLLHNLENKYKPLNKAVNNDGYIVILGAGNGGYSHYPANDKLSSASLSRLIEGIRLHKLMPNSKLVLSGGRIFGSPPDSSIMNNVASMLGISPQNIIMEAGSQDTYQEAINLKKILGDKKFILVTSAFHMPRSMALFQHQGMNPIAAPTQLLLGKKRYSVKHYFPNSIYLIYSDIAIHEYLGMFWARLTRKI